MVYCHNIIITKGEDIMISWMCNQCGYTLEKDTPPEKCPSCNKECSFIDNTCYTPDCAGKPNDPRIKKQ